MSCNKSSGQNGSMHSVKGKGSSNANDSTTSQPEYNDHSQGSTADNKSHFMYTQHNQNFSPTNIEYTDPRDPSVNPPAIMVNQSLQMTKGEKRQSYVPSQASREQTRPSTQSW